MNGINQELIAQLIVLAFLIEAVWETLKMIRQDNKFSIDRIGVTIVALLFIFNFKLDLFHAVGLSDEMTAIGLVSTGILSSRGSNFIHDIFKRINKKEW